MRATITAGAICQDWRCMYEQETMKCMLLTSGTRLQSLCTPKRRAGCGFVLTPTTTPLCAKYVPMVCKREHTYWRGSEPSVGPRRRCASAVDASLTPGIRRPNAPCQW